MNERNLPYANLCITSICNYRCFYCQSGGENHCKNSSIHMKYETAKEILDALSYIGISRIRITGGEPTLNPDFTKIVQHALSLKFTKVRISTNATNIIRNIDVLNDSRVRIQVSLDTLDKEKFYSITGKNDLENVIEALDRLSKEHINTRINMVLMNSNKYELSEMISFCQSKGFSLKLLGIELLDCYDKSRVKNEILSNSEYTSIIETLGKMESQILAPGDLGIAMGEYLRDNVKIRIRFFNGWGAKYSVLCEGCSIYPCPSGIYLIQVLADGNISLCRFRRSTSFNASKLDYKVIIEEISKMLKSTLGSNKLMAQSRRVEYGITKFIEIP